MKLHYKPIGQPHKVLDFDNKRLAAMCLDICGGGINAKQVAAAMQMQDRLLKGQLVTLPVSEATLQIPDLEKSE